MTWWSIEPRDPLLIRDGRPFSAEARAARSQDFPPPSVLAGALRTRIGFALRRPNDCAFALSPQVAREIRVSGPLLLEEAPAQPPRVLVSPPRDAVLFERSDTARWPAYRVAPTDPWRDGVSSLPERLRPISPVGTFPRSKPARDAPAFWALGLLRRWLTAPAHISEIRPADTAPALPHETRIHVKVSAETGTAEDGALFSTDGLRFSMDQGSWSGLRRLRLLAHCAHTALAPGHQAVGGERRLSRLELAPPVDMLDWPAPQLEAPQAPVVLLTPAWFEGGAVPEALAGARVVAAAVGRPVVVSGWDLAARGPKVARRLAPAGSVYWVETPGDPYDWARRVHLTEISDGEQNRRDGFGLAAVGVWK